MRLNARLEVGALTESVTVTTEAALLKTDKADVSVDLRPEEVVNLPLNQYRNYQALLNLVPGATPPALQNAQTDTPGRALTSNVNGTSRNTNTTRIDGAASINVWLPHHAGYIAPAETVENVNISTNSFDAATGMAGGAAMSVSTKSGTNNLRGSAFYFRNQDEFNARQGYFDPVKLDASTSIMGGTVGGPIVRNRLFYFGGWERNLQNQSRFDQFTVPDREDAQRRLQRGAGLQRKLPHLRPEDRQPDDGRRPHRVSGRGDSCRSHQLHLEGRPGPVPGAQQPRHQQRSPEQPVRGTVAARRRATTTT